MKWSTLLFVLSIGTRLTADQLVPVALSECARTMSLVLHDRRNRQSVHATYTVPLPSTSADGSGPSRRLPATAWCRIVAMVVVALHDAPPLVELNAPTAVSLALSIGTTTVPLGRTTGWPPITPEPLEAAADQVWPPSVEVLILSRLPAPWSSHSV